MVRTRPDDDHDVRLLADVESHGWHLVEIEGDADGPGYVFSVGIYHTIGKPELCIFGLRDGLIMAQILNRIGDLMREGREFNDWHANDDVIEGYSCIFRSVRRELYREYFGYACWYHEGLEFPMLQCVWPDREGSFPWNSNYNAELIAAQPVLANVDHWPFLEPKNQAVFTTAGIIEEGLPILRVIHDDEGEWQFHCEFVTSIEDARLVCLKTVVESHPSVTELADLPQGWTATRESADKPWSRSSR